MSDGRTGTRIHLIGGGRDEAFVPALYGPFLRDAGEGARVGVLLVDEGDGDGPTQFERFAGVLNASGACVPVPLLVPIGERFDAALLDGVDALFVGGGLTPAYQAALADCRKALADVLRERGVPFAGFSAGAAVAARDAVVGGWLGDGVPVCPEDTAEDLEEVEVRPGLGLVPFSVDVHAAQWGTLARLVSAVGRGLTASGIALDENTALRITAEPGAAAPVARVDGVGRAHLVRREAAGDGVVVRSYRAGAIVPAW
ncbi:Type 1 glutamine amidotransferase-like domain-containing protein [Streptomyces sp. NPDC056600]|uniref:Type 1 glutamine amidotransferase-like domain-containing protein n=1 Tax=Streptomyces sp. NPDC056600 TaxID=3345874 RepID=UPI0036CE77A7